MGTPNLIFGEIHSANVVTWNLASNGRNEQVKRADLARVVHILFLKKDWKDGGSVN